MFLPYKKLRRIHILVCNLQVYHIQTIQNNKILQFLKQLPAKKLQNNLKYWGIYNLNSVIISRVLKILASQNRFQSLYDEILNIDRFVE